MIAVIDGSDRRSPRQTTLSQLGASIVTPAIAAATDEQAAEMRESLDAEESQLMHARLWKWRKKLSTDFVGDIGFFGDSMIAGTPVTAELRPLVTKTFGLAGFCYLEPYESGGATKFTVGTSIFTHWFTGTLVRLTAAAHVATVNLDNAVGVEANTLKLYYVKKPGGGVFKVQTRFNGGTWTDEAAHLTVSTDAAVDGGIISITKTNIRVLWEIRAVWVSGEVDIIGGALYDTRLRGARYGMFAVGGTNLEDNITASTVVTGTIMADIGVDLAMLSHLDGAAGVTDTQGQFQDMINTASGTAPNWLCIGPPVGQNDVEDALRSAQTDAMRSLANTRRDAFWDNRRWAGTSAQAVATGLHDGTSDPHYENLAAANWLPRMFHELGLAETRNTTAGAAATISLNSGGSFRMDDLVPSPVADIAYLGNFAVGGSPGTTGQGFLKLYDSAGPVNNNDWGGFQYTSNLFNFFTGAVARWTIDAGVGRGPYWYHSSSTAATPLGLIGNSFNPILEIHIGKTVVAPGTTAPQTINKTSGRINFAAGETSKVVTCDRCTVNSLPIATVATNDATMKSAIAIAGAGSFTLHANASPTAETAVNWFLIP